MTKVFSLWSNVWGADPAPMKVKLTADQKAWICQHRSFIDAEKEARFQDKPWAFVIEEYERAWEIWYTMPDYEQLAMCPVWHQMEVYRDCAVLNAQAEARSISRAVERCLAEMDEWLAAPVDWDALDMADIDAYEARYC